MKNELYNVNNVHNVIKSEMTKRNIKQHELSEMIHVSPVTLNRYLKGERKMPLDVAVEIANALQVDFEYLLRGCRNEKKPDEKNEITLNDFLNMWWFRDFPVAVVPYADFDDAAERGMSLEQYIDNGEHDVLFSLAASGADAYQVRAYIRDRYAYARVKAFMFMDAWCVIGIEEYEPDDNSAT